MGRAELTQSRADELIKIEKHRVTEEEWDFPQFGGNLRIPIISINKKEQFTLDISRNHINLERGKYQNRARICIVLVRLDFGGPPHRNPDDREISCPHIHIYREGYGDSWAFKIDISEFPNIGNLSLTLDDFMNFCNISKPPFINRGLFVL